MMRSGAFYSDQGDVRGASRLAHYSYYRHDGKGLRVAAASWL